jgi:hypothetical protein
VCVCVCAFSFISFHFSTFLPSLSPPLFYWKRKWRCSSYVLNQTTPTTVDIKNEKIVANLHRFDAQVPFHAFIPVTEGYVSLSFHFFLFLSLFL